MTRDYLLEEDEPFNRKSDEQWRRMPDDWDETTDARQPWLDDPMSLSWGTPQNMRYNSRHSVAFLLTRQRKEHTHEKT